MILFSIVPQREFADNPSWMKRVGDKINETLIPV
jgi:hypothetical protein